MPPNLLILGGTLEASALAGAVAEKGMTATLSYAGRVERLKEQPIPRRVGGFGGVCGLAQYLRDHKITHVVDATHPFAAQMSENAVVACRHTATRLLALTRPPWCKKAGDDWQNVCDIAAAVTALSGPAKRVMLAIGRMHLAQFSPCPQHQYLLRLVDAPDVPPPLPHHRIIISRGPFSVAGDAALLQDHDIELVVAKNSGGSGAQAKILAARQLGLPVLMIDRPVLSPRDEVGSVDAALDWLAHDGTERGV